MIDDENSFSEGRVTQIKRLVEDFERKFTEKTSDPDSFASLHEIEQMWGELRANTDKIYSDMVQDESELIRKKNEYKEKGITLHAQRRVKKEIATL